MSSNDEMSDEAKTKSRMMYYDLHYNMIRLATLLPGDWTDEICCTLRSAQLELHPEYTALSYAWGSANVTRTIWLNQQRFPVTVNLAAALRRLRKADTEVTLWADAICINQANHMERTAQVKLMRRIFEGASEVVLDLGETQDQRHGSMRAYMEPKPASNIFSFEESEIALVASFKERYLSGTSTRQRDFAFEVFCLLRSLADPRQMEDLPEITESMGNPPVTRFQRALFESLRLMMRCRWWNRMWTIQEVIVPNYLKVVYGSSVAPWKMFVEAAKHWRVLSSCLPREHTNVLKLFARVVLDIDQMRETWSQGSQTTLLPLLRQFSDRGATDDRDRVYALLSLVRDDTQAGDRLEPDYSIHTAKVFENTVLNIIHTTGSLDVLSLDVGRKNRQDLPSWVPDWTATIDQVDRRRSLSFNVHRATLQSKVFVQRKRHEGVVQYLQSAWISSHPEASVEDRNWMYIDHEEICSGEDNFWKTTWTGDWTGERITQALGHRGWLLPDRRIFENLQNSISKSSNLPNRNIDYYGPMTDHGDNMWLDVAENMLPEMLLSSVEEYLKFNENIFFAESVEHRAFVVPASFIDRIEFVGTVRVSDDDLIPVIRSWIYSMSEIHIENQASSNVHRFLIGDAFCRTLCGGILPSQYRSDQSHQAPFQISDQPAVLRWLLDNVISVPTDHPKDPQSIMFEDLRSRHWDFAPEPSPFDSMIEAAIEAATARRGLFITTQGIPGLGPVGMKRGDQVFLLPGASTPFILRRVGSQGFDKTWRHINTAHELVGGCYADGLMDGNAMVEYLFVLGQQRMSRLLKALPDNTKPEVVKSTGELISYLLDQLTDQKIFLGPRQIWRRRGRVQGLPDPYSIYLPTEVFLK